MPERVESLRQQLRERGYLTRGIERWFALDPWSSRTFWVELATVAAKAATLIAIFGGLPLTAVMLVRNAPLTAVETLELFVLYAALWFVTALAEVVVIAGLLKSRPQLAIDTPRALLAISIAGSAALIIPLGLWWYRFDSPPAPLELIAGGLLGAAFFVVSVIVISAALLSFSIYELKRIPTIHQKSRTVPLTAAAAALIALLFVPAFATPEQKETPPPQIATTPTRRHLAIIAVDGLTADILHSRPDLAAQFTSLAAASPTEGDSTAERWASLGTGVPARLHRVRSVDGIRLAGASHLLQSVSRGDFILRQIATALHIARREPLPPTVRRRDFVWEIVAARGVPAVAVNWWTSDDLRSATLTSVGQAAIFGSSHGDPIRLDSAAVQRLLAAVRGSDPQLATVYLPALDVILNRVASDPSAKLASSIRVLDGISAAVSILRSLGYDVLLAGMPGESQTGRAVIAATFPLRPPRSAFDVAPTTLDMLGFPLSEEMPGRSLTGTGRQSRIATYGERARSEASTRLNEEYYQSLRSLGYIR